MSSRARLSARLALATVVLPAFAFAQDSIVPFGQEDSPRAHLRDRYRKPENSQKLSDSVRKLKSEDVEERLDAIRTLGQLDDPKATEYLVAAASDPDDVVEALLPLCLRAVGAEAGSIRELAVVRRQEGPS